MRRLDGGQVTDAVKHHQTAVLDAGCDALQTLWRCRNVQRAGDRQHRCRDFGESAGDVEVRQGFAHLRVGLVIGVAQRVQQRGGGRRAVLREAGAEPALLCEFDHLAGA